MGLYEVAQLWKRRERFLKLSLDHQFLQMADMFSLCAAYMRIIVLGGQFLQVQQGLVYTLLQLQGALQGLQATPPLVSLRFL